MFCHGNFNWQGRVGLGLGLELVMVRVRNKVKDIGSGFGIVSGLVAHLAKIPQIFRNFNYKN